MDARRARTMAAATFAIGLLVSTWVAPVAAAECALSAPLTARVGTPLTINGTDFPVSTAVDIALTIEGGAPDEFSVQSDAAGAFLLSLTPEATETGLTTVVATAGALCTAQVIVTVQGANDPAPTAPTATPTGSGAAASDDPGPPRTDTAVATGSHATDAPLIPWLLAAVTLTIGVAGLGATRPTRDR